MVNGGVTLFELRRAAGEAEHKYYSMGMFGSSGSSLHAKTFSVDTERVLVGLLNFDPRSAHLNTELGFVSIARNRRHALHLAGTWHQISPMKSG